MANEFSIKDMYVSYVNLAHRTDRLSHMKQQLERIGLQAERFEAIRTVDDSWNRPPYQKMFNRTRGAIGCYLSQCEVLKKGLALGKTTMVMEDDCYFCQDWDLRMGYIANFLKDKDWDIVWLGATFHTNPAWWHSGTNPQIKNRGIFKDAEQTNDPHIFRTFGAFCTYAYVVNFNSIPKVLQMLEERIPTSIGIDFSMIEMQPDLITYAMVPGSVRQIDNKSDIGHGDTIFSGFAALGAYWFQEKMTCFNPVAYDFGEASHHCSEAIYEQIMYQDPLKQIAKKNS
jgi:GR25 family glycosyltransferase involved in LPS biosynthesis